MHAFASLCKHQVFECFQHSLHLSVAFPRCLSFQVTVEAAWPKFPEKTMQRLLSLGRVRAWRLAPLAAWSKPKASLEDGSWVWAPLALGSALLVASQVHHGLKCELAQKLQGLRAEGMMQSMLKSKGLGFRTQIRMHSNVATGAKTDIRIIDIVDGQGGFHEVKSGRVSWSQRTIDQIDKDIGILSNNPECKSYTWEFFPGKDGKIDVDPRILKKLKDGNIKYNFHHDINSPEAQKLLSSTNKKVLEGTKDTTALKPGESKLQTAANQAKILKAVGAVNLAVSVLSLGATLYLRHDISSLEKQLPEVKDECRGFLQSLKKVEHLLDEVIAQPKDRLENRQCEISQELKQLKIQFETLRQKCLRIIARAESDKARSEATALVSGCTVVIGLIVTIASCGCDCGAGVAMGLTSMGTGTLGAAISVENMERCNQMLSQMNRQVGQITSEYLSVEKRYHSLLEVLDRAVQCHLAGAVWRVLGWTHSTNGIHRITSIGRPDSLSLLKHLGDGSVLEAKGKQVMIGNYNGNGDVSVCQIQNIWQKFDFYEANVQCTHLHF